MNIGNVLKSPHQRRNFLALSAISLIICFSISFFIAYYFEGSIFWGVFNDFFISAFASAAFSIFAILYMAYFFRDPNDIVESSLILPEDVSETLRNIGNHAISYRIFVRTGRHFRAETLPILIKSAKQKKQRVRIDVVLLDFRDYNICVSYANFRRNYSFDKTLWSPEYTQSEILATILDLYRRAKENQGVIDINVSLSTRLSMFRIEGSSEELMITREDPRDTAARYRRANPEFGSYMTEFDWIQDRSDKIPSLLDFDNENALIKFFESVAGIETLREIAHTIDKRKSPYAK